jgi:hypothetical protein
MSTLKSSWLAGTEIHLEMVKTEHPKKFATNSIYQ